MHEVHRIVNEQRLARVVRVDDLQHAVPEDVLFILLGLVQGIRRASILPNVNHASVAAVVADGDLRVVVVRVVEVAQGRVEATAPRSVVDSGHASIPLAASRTVQSRECGWETHREPRIANRISTAARPPSAPSLLSICLLAFLHPYLPNVVSGVASLLELGSDDCHVPWNALKPGHRVGSVGVARVCIRPRIDTHTHTHTHSHIHSLFLSPRASLHRLTYVDVVDVNRQPPRKQRAPRRRAKVKHIVLLKANATHCKRVDVGRLDLGSRNLPVVAHITPAPVVLRSETRLCNSALYTLCIITVTYHKQHQDMRPGSRR